MTKDHDTFLNQGVYRKIVLEEGDLLEFFQAIYFFVESLAVIGSVSGAYPETLRSAAPVR